MATRGQPVRAWCVMRYRSAATIVSTRLGSSSVAFIAASSSKKIERSGLACGARAAGWRNDLSESGLGLPGGYKAASYSRDQDPRPGHKNKRVGQQTTQIAFGPVGPGGYVPIRVVDSSPARVCGH